ncbi:MAG: hypothetical protein A3H01_02450 [Candidatus Wildermuthbacteria bacterium RIFCSPLOWO2_12_FULL_40_9]|uniref:PD-(D/E)XK endonuclease-like domain-containing protein n=1 Tax=Candidatus Wildermuthbacteria bacterium RIFCSPLOWO2_12_FULL_40_9 TaxID=1802467 RepID=A0A1G2RVS3_9BACT|nr:MAG: hypothetical protein A3H01_02450 [Candidatus Wildermuthbacteria bacterium RIFCSPLOWO2_12_FULL_40_9]
MVKTSLQAIALSPNSLNLFLECRRCFWLEKKWKIRRPPPYPYALNMAVDILLKQEFDNHRAKNEIHPLILANNIPARLFSNQGLLNRWRSNLAGIRYYDAKLDATLFGAVDDVLEFSGGVLAPLDYKSTGSNVPTVYDRFQLQMDIYTFLLEKNGFKTNKKGYLAFYIVNKKDGFGDRLPFKKELHEINTNPEDVPKLFKEAVAVLRKDSPSPHNQDCKFCQWSKQVSNF